MPISDAKRIEWRAIKQRHGLTARSICDEIKRLEPALPRPTETTLRAILAGRTRATPLATVLEKIFAGHDDRVEAPAAPQGVRPGDYEAALLDAYRLALQAGGDPKAVADAAVEAMAAAVQAWLRERMLDLLP